MGVMIPNKVARFLWPTVYIQYGYGRQIAFSFEVVPK